MVFLWFTYYFAAPFGTTVFIPPPWRCQSPWVLRRAQETPAVTLRASRLPAMAVAEHAAKRQDLSYF